MIQILVAVGAVIAAAAAAVPIAAICLVSFASRREESAHSLSGEAPNAAARAARRLLGYRPEPAAATRYRHAQYSVQLVPEARQPEREPAGTRA